MSLHSRFRPSRGTDSQLDCPNQEANLRGRDRNRLSKSPPAIMLVIA